jgi:predicted GNAT family acetyltransferase
MNPVIDIFHFNILIKEAKSNGKRLISNCYLLPGEISKYINQHLMFWDSSSNGVLFFCEEKEFYFLYFFLPEAIGQDQIYSIEKCTKPVIIDLVYLDSKKPQSLSNIQNQWEQNGFCVYTTYRRMSLVTPHVEAEWESWASLEKNGFLLTYAEPSLCREILKLWRQSLNPFSTSLPNEDEMVELMLNKHISCIVDKNNQVVAALQLQQNGKVCTFKHLVVNEKFRKQGFAQILFQSSIGNHKDISKYILWVDEKNIPATSLYIKSGFYYDGKISCQLVYKTTFI